MCVKERSGGLHCIAPGCINYFYNNSCVRYHRLLVNHEATMRAWLHNLKRTNPPTHANARVCSNHFVESDYIKVGKFDEEGRFAMIPSKNLCKEAVPIVFNFETYNISATDAPSTSKIMSEERLNRLIRRREAKTEEVRNNLLIEDSRSFCYLV